MRRFRTTGRRRNAVGKAFILTETAGRVTAAHVIARRARIRYRREQIEVVGNIGDRIAVESPLVLQNIRHESAARRTLDGADLAERAHKSAHADVFAFDLVVLGRFDGDLEGAEFDLSRTLLGHERSDTVTVGLLVVEREVLGSGDKTVIQRAHGEFHGDDAAKHGIFGIVVAVASVVRMAVSVKSGAPEYGKVYEQRLNAYDLAEFALKVGIEGGCDERAQPNTSIS